MTWVQPLLSSPSSTWPVHSVAWSLRCSSRHQSPSTAISHHWTLYDLPLCSGRLVGCVHSGISILTLKRQKLLFSPWRNLNWKFPLSAPIRYQSWPKRNKSRVRGKGWGFSRKKWKSSCLVNGPLILSLDRRQRQPGGGSGHQLAWIDTFLSRLQLSLLRASTDCNISFFPPSWKSQRPFSCHWKAGRHLSVSTLTDE